MGAFFSPKGMTKNSKCPYLVLKAVLYSSPSLIRTKLYADFKSNLVNTFSPLTLSSKSLINGKGYELRIVISFNFL